MVKNSKPLRVITYTFNGTDDVLGLLWAAIILSRSDVELNQSVCMLLKRTSGGSDDQSHDM